MYAGQRLVAADGYEVALFPMDDMYLTQGEYGSVSHDLAMDFQGWSNGQRVYQCPYYAPFSCTCVRAGGSGENYRIFTSDTPVHCADGGFSVLTFVVMHDNNPIANEGDHFTQGDLIGHSGTARPAGTQPMGDHMHLNVAWGGYAGWTPTSYGPPYYELTNSIHIYDGLYVNDTILTVDGGYNWRTYTGPTPPPPTPIQEKKHRFPWVLYARKFRNRRGDLTNYFSSGIIKSYLLNDLTDYFSRVIYKKSRFLKSTLFVCMYPIIKTYL